MNILVIRNQAFNEEDVISIFDSLGYKTFSYAPSDDISKHQSESITKELSSFIEHYDIQVVFSFNYYPIVSYAIKDTAVKYISYVYDSPHIALYTYSILFPNNYIFIFDFETYNELKSGGINTVYYLPLSVNTVRINSVCSQKSNEVFEVSFVGSLYNDEHNLYERLMEKLGSTRTKGYLDGLVQMQSKVYGKFFIPELIVGNILKDIKKAYPYNAQSDSIATDSYVYAHYFLARKVTSIERLHLLNEVSNYFNLALFTGSDASFVPNATCFGAIDYYNKMPQIFNSSKINLNISLKSILSGIPLRCIDVMASGGFLLTNYQSDLKRHFINGQDYEYFTDEYDLLKKIEYYLDHEDEREAIAVNGKNKVNQNHRLDKMLPYMLQCATK